LDKIHRKTNVFPISSITMRGYVFRCGELKDPRYTESVSVVEVLPVKAHLLVTGRIS